MKTLNPTAASFVPLGGTLTAAAAAVGSDGAAAAGGPASAQKTPPHGAAGGTPSAATPITIRASAARPPAINTANNGAAPGAPTTGSGEQLLSSVGSGCPTTPNGLAELACLLTGDLTFEDMFNHGSRRESVSLPAV
jgi:hypothetical protein